MPGKEESKRCQLVPGGFAGTFFLYIFLVCLIVSLQELVPMGRSLRLQHGLTSRRHLGPPPRSMSSTKHYRITKDSLCSMVHIYCYMSKYQINCESVSLRSRPLRPQVGGFRWPPESSFSSGDHLDRDDDDDG